MEFLVAYGWLILAGAVVIASLVSFGIIPLHQQKYISCEETFKEFARLNPNINLISCSSFFDTPVCKCSFETCENITQKIQICSEKFIKFEGERKDEIKKNCEEGETKVCATLNHSDCICTKKQNG